MAEDGRGGFWTTVPGILTGVAAVLTAIGGLALALGQSGVLRSGVAVTSAIHPVVPTAAGDAPGIQGAAAPPETAAAATAARPTAQAAIPAAAASPATNLLAADAGGHLVAASSDAWKVTIDGDEARSDYLTGEGVYAFKDGKAATFDTFGVLIPTTSGFNLAEYELSAGDASPTGPFHVIGRFTTQNIKMFDAPYQEAHFAAVTARYIRVKIIRSFDGGNTVYGCEFRLR